MFSLIDHLSTPLIYLTQSLWRDEAFSYVLAKHSIFQIIKLTAGDFNPPLYYLFLHFWMEIFGSSEIAMRGLSFLFHLLTCCVAFKFIPKVLNKNWGAFVFLGFLFNPILFYYGFEARMYSMLAFFSLLSIYLFYEKRWKLWVLVNIFGAYTHSFFWLTIFSEVIYIFILKKGGVKSFLKRLAVVLASFLFWIPVLLTQLTRGNQSFWVSKIDFGTVASSLGNIFTSYEGTPGGLWRETALLSLLILGVAFLVYKRRRDDFVRLMLIWLFCPLVLVLTVSFFKPIFVNRYVVFAALPMISLLLVYISFNKRFYKVSSIIFLGFEIFVVLYLGPYLKKVDIRERVRQIEMQMKSDDILVSRTPLTFFESTYYSGFRSYLYSQSKDIPSYLGSVVIPKDRILYKLSGLTGRVFLLNDDGSYGTIPGRL